MKIWVGIVFAFCLLRLFVFPVFAVPLIAAETYDTQWKDYCDTLPSDVAELLPESLSSAQSNIKTSSLLRCTSDYVTSGIGIYGGYLLSLVAVLLMISVFEILKQTIGVQALHGVFTLAGNLSLSLVIMTTQTRLIEYSLSFLRALMEITTGTLPIFASVFAASGNYTVAAVHSGGVSVLIVLIENVFCRLLAPLLNVCFCFHFASVFTQNRYFDGIHKLLKSVYTTMLVVVMSVFSFAFGAKEVLAAGTDNAILRGAKYAVGSFVPVVTSIVSGSLSTVSSALTVIKNSCGIFVIFVILLLMLPVIISLVLNRFVLRLASGIAGMLGEERQEKLLNDTASLNGYLISLVVSGAMLFIYFLALVVLTTLALR